MTPISLWIVEDDGGYRRSLQKSFLLEESIRCTEVFPSCLEMLASVELKPHPDLVLMDLGLPGMNGLEGIRRLHELAPDVAVVVLTVAGEKAMVLEAVEVGAAGYLLKTSTMRELVDGIQKVIEGGAALSPEVARIVLDTLRKPDAPTFDLTPREVEVIELLARGLSVKEIAANLDISRRTSAFHLQNIYRKLEVQSQAGAVAVALRTGVI